MEHYPNFFKKSAKAYYYLVLLGGFLKSPLLLACRLFWGWQFMQGGLEKLGHVEEFSSLLQSLNIPLPLASAYLVCYTELIGGVCLMIGLASRLVSIPLAITMIVAYATVHIEGLKAIFNDPNLFISQAPFNFLLISLFVLAFGPGRFSVDYILEKWLFQTA